MKTIFNRRFSRAKLLAVTCALFTAATVRAAEIKVVTSGAFTAAYLKLVPEYERAAHHKLVPEFGPSMGTTMPFRCAWNAERRSMSSSWRRPRSPS